MACDGRIGAALHQQRQGFRPRRDLAVEMSAPDRVEIDGTLTDAQGKSGRYTAMGTAKPPDATFRGSGRFDDYDCTFEARRIQ